MSDTTMAAPTGDGSALTLTGENAAFLTLAAADLRWACPCAWCRAARLRGDIRAVDPDVRLVACNSMGYGVQLVFSDGHDRGVYPWRYLRELAAT